MQQQIFTLFSKCLVLTNVTLQCCLRLCHSYAIVIVSAPKSFHSTPIVCFLHINYKVVSLTFRTLQTSQPSYLRSLLTIQPHRSVWSSSCLTLLRHPSITILKSTNQLFRVSAPQLWDKLPPHLRSPHNNITSTANTTDQWPFLRHCTLQLSLSVRT